MDSEATKELFLTIANTVNGEGSDRVKMKKLRELVSQALIKIVEQSMQQQQ